MKLSIAILFYQEETLLILPSPGWVGGRWLILQVGGNRCSGWTKQELCRCGSGRGGPPTAMDWCPSLETERAGDLHDTSSYLGFLKKFHTNFLWMEQLQALWWVSSCESLRFRLLRGRSSWSDSLRFVKMIGHDGGKGTEVSEPLARQTLKPYKLQVRGHIWDAVCWEMS